VRLELLDHHLADIQWGEQTLFGNGTLFLNPTDVQNQIKDPSGNLSVRLELARPGESKRIVHVLDTFHPVEKLHPGLHAFPGFDHPATLVGAGRTVRLRNMLLISS
jgi:glycine reductase